MIRRARNRSASEPSASVAGVVAAEALLADQSVQSTGISPRDWSGNSSRRWGWPERSRWLMSWRRRPSNGWPARVMATDSGRSWRGVVCRGFLRYRRSRLDDAIPRASNRRHASLAIDSQVAHRRGCRKREEDRGAGRHAARCGDLTASGQHRLALRLRPVGAPMAWAVMPEVT